MNSIQQDYARTYRTMQVISIVSIVALVAISISFFYIYTRDNAEKARSIYVVTDKGTMSAYLTEEATITSFECDVHSRAFVNAMFAHDKNSYEQHLKDALNLIDEASGLSVVEQFEQGNVLKNYIKWGSRTEVSIDSIPLVENGAIPRYQCYFKQRHYIGSDLKQELAIAIEYDMLRSYRHAKNPHGLLISNLNFISYHKTTDS